MDIRMDASLGASYHSLQQQARVITEAWAADNMYCVMCGAPIWNHCKIISPWRICFALAAEMFSN